MQCTVSETAPHVWSVFDEPFHARKPLAQFTDALDAELWAAARQAAEALRDGPRKVRLINALADTAQRGHRDVMAFCADAA